MKAREGGDAGGGWRFEPFNDAQRAFMECDAPEVMLSGAFGAGKSRLLCEKALFLSLYYPGNVGLLCRKVAADLPSTTLKTFLEEVCPAELILDHNQTKKLLVIDTGVPNRPSEIYYRGLDRPQGVGSMNLGHVEADEGIELEEEDWTMLEGRLRLGRVPFHQISTATNPGAPSHWLYRRFYLERPLDARDRPIRRVFESDGFQNPYNPQSFRDRLNRLRGVHFKRFAKGEWVGFEGLVYGEFHPGKHIIDRFPIPRDWPRWRVFDFGTANPFVCQWWTKHPTKDQLIMYREIYMTGRRIEEHAKDVVEHSKGEAFEADIADHDLDQRLTLEEHGISTFPAEKDVASGIQAVAERLAINPVTGEPGMVFMRDALIERDPVLEAKEIPTSTTEEFPVYMWAKGAHGTSKDQPLKKNDHGMDAARYLVMHLEAPGERFEFGVLTDDTTEEW